MNIIQVTPSLSLLELEIPMKGYRNFLGTYFFQGDKKALVDVGPTSAIPSLLAGLKQMKVKPADIDYIVLTHIHVDHAGGTGTALNSMPHARVLAHPRAIRHLVDPTRLWEATKKTLPEMVVAYQPIQPVSEDRIDAVEDGMKLDLGKGVVLELYLTPGHAPHHLSIFDRANRLLIAGEVAGTNFDGTARPATPPPFKLEEMLESLDRVAALKPKLICYSHFGCYDNAEERLRLYREKLISWSQMAREAAKAGKSPQDILGMLKDQDIDLAGLEAMGPDEYHREHMLLVNAIRGLAGIEVR